MSHTIDRRTLMKTGVVAGAAAVITSKKTAVFAQSASSPPPVAPPVMCDTTPANSPPTAPFVDTLPVPMCAVPTILSPFPTKAANIAAGEAARDDHQRWDEFRPLVFYHSIAAPSLHTFHRDFSPTYLWTFNGRYPAQTFLGLYGLPSLVRFRNNLPIDVPVEAIPQLTVHLHN